jgi:hypothetical protein
MTYSCALCNYSTNDRRLWSKHIRTVKHITRDEQNRESLRTKYICNLCNLELKSSSGFSRHKIKCQENYAILKYEKEKLEKEKFEFEQTKRLHELERECHDLKIERKLEREKEHEKVQFLEKERKLEREKEHEKVQFLEKERKLEQEKEHEKVKFLEKENEYHKNLVISSGDVIKTSINTVNKSLSAINFITKYYNDAPPLKALDDYSAVIADKSQFIRNLIPWHNNNTIVMEFGDILKAQYIKENPKDQSLWTSDITRLNYQLKNLHPSIWINDKNGNETRNRIIVPFLDYIKFLTSGCLAHLTTQYTDTGRCANTEILHMMEVLASVIRKIETKKLANEINRYIASYFQLGKEQLLLLEQSKKLLTDKAQACKEDNNVDADVEAAVKAAVDAAVEATEAAENATEDAAENDEE